MSEIVKAIDPIITLAKELGLLERLKSRIFRDAPKDFFIGLERIISELIKSFDAINYVIDRFMDLSFDTTKIEDSKKFLEDLKFDRIKVPSKDPNNEAGQPLFINIYDALGSCNEIGNLYRKYLDKWISKKISDKKVSELDKRDYEDLKVLVRDKLTQSDRVFIDNVDGLKLSLKKVSGDILLLIDPPDPNELNTNLAKEKIREQKVILDGPRIELGNSISNLFRLKADFIEKSKLVTD
jgi:hypothetical protein